MAAQPLLFGAPGRARRASSQSLDFQGRLGRPPAGDPHGPVPGVVVLTRAADREVDELSLRLAVRGVPMLRLDSDRAAGLDLTWDVLDGIVETTEGRFEPRAVWLRYFSGASVPSHGSGGLDDYVRQQWVAWSRMLLAMERCHVVNSTATCAAPDRVAQLAGARRAGIRVPATMVTSRPSTAADRIPGDGDLVVKSLGLHFVEPVPGQLRTLSPRRMSRAHVRAAKVAEPAPVMVQEYVPCTSRLRVYAVGGELIAFASGAPGTDAQFGDDPFSDAEGRHVVQVQVPDGLRRPLESLARRWQLDVAAFDLLETPDGPVFLEVDTACDWLGHERGAGVSSVTDAVAGLLEHNFRAIR
ncbi:MAG TPA: hypothetical protein VH141_14150 [Pseudonocardia sp.]|jgi:glutathione synthase/RimK-type ligase-like ATP-grasp enzyme|nr:hypothetical protein [Pseudonocardia sp.]